MSANQWFHEMLKTLPEGASVKEACLEQQRQEVALHQRMQAMANGKKKS